MPSSLRFDKITSPGPASCGSISQSVFLGSLIGANQAAGYRASSLTVVLEVSCLLQPVIISAMKLMIRFTFFIATWLWVFVFLSQSTKVQVVYLLETIF